MSEMSFRRTGALVRECPSSTYLLVHQGGKGEKGTLRGETRALVDTPLVLGGTDPTALNRQLLSSAMTRRMSTPSLFSGGSSRGGAASDRRGTSRTHTHSVKLRHPYTALRCQLQSYLVVTPVAQRWKAPRQLLRWWPLVVEWWRVRSW